MSKGKVIKCCDSVVYDMPSLKRTDVARPERREAPPVPERRVEEVEREAYERGFAVGERAGIEMGEQKAGLLLERLEGIISEVTALKSELIRELEPQVIDLATTIARRIVIEEITVRPEVIVNIAKEAMKKIERTGRIHIRLHPRLHDLFMRLRPELLEIHPDIVFDVDPAAPLTGPVVIGEREMIMTDLASQMSHIVEDMEGGHVAP